MEENQRELATNRLLEIIRRGRAAKPSEAEEKPAPPKEKKKRREAAPPAEAVREPSVPREAAPEVKPEAVRPAEAGRGLLDKVISRPVEVAPPPPEAEALPVSLPESLLPLHRRLLKRLLAYLKRPPAVPEKAPKKISLPTLKGKGKRILALDIGTAAVKLIEMVKQAGTFRLVSLEVRPIPPAMRKRKSGLDVLLAKTLRELLPSKRLAKSELHVVLPDQSAQFRTIDLPVVAAKERLNAIRFQIKKELPFPLEVCDINYRGWVPKVKGRQEVEVLAVDRRVLGSQLELLSEVGLLPVHITSTAASARFLIADYSGIDTKKGAVAIADIGAAKTTVTILEGGKLVLCRTIATGGEDFTAVLQGLGLGPNGEDLTDIQAEQYKMDIGLPAEGDSTTMRIAILMRPVAERISAELARSLDFYRRGRGHADLNKLILVGGGALMKRLPEFLAKHLGIDVEVGDPLARVQSDPDMDQEMKSQLVDSGPTLLPALAVALDDGRELNVLPPEEKSIIKLRRAKSYVPPAAAALMVVMIGLHTMALKSLDSSDIQHNLLKSQITELDNYRAQFLVTKAEFDKFNAEMAGRRQDFESIRIGDPEITNYLQLLSHLVPSNIYFDRIRTRFIPKGKKPEAAEEEGQGADTTSSRLEEFNRIKSDLTLENGETRPVKRPVYGRTLELKGHVYPQGSITDVQLVDFVFALESSGYFREVAVDSLTTLDSGKVRFTIICGI